MVIWDFDTEDAEYIKELSQEFSVPVNSVTAYERKMTSKNVDKAIELAKIVWAKIINFYPPYRSDIDTVWISEYLPKLQEKNKDITLSVINVEPKTFLFFIPEYKDATLTTIKKLTGSSSLYVSNVDPSTWVDLLKTFSLLWNSIKNVYLSDKSWTKKELMLWKGDMPLRDLLWKLKEKSYDWAFTVKVAPKEISAWKDKKMIEKLDSIYDYFEKYYKKA